MIQSSLKHHSPGYARLSLLVGLACLCWQASAGAQLVITSANPNIFTATPGQTASLSATVQNLFSSSFYFLGDNANFTIAPGPTEIGPPTSHLTVALDDTPFAGMPGAPAFSAIARSRRTARHSPCQHLCRAECHARNLYGIFHHSGKY